MGEPKNMWVVTGRFVILLLAFCIVGFLALRSSPYLAEIPWMPFGLGNWADQHGMIRNIPAFAVLYLITVGCTGWRFRVYAFIGICIIAAGLEIIQIRLPGRIYELNDILASWVGVGIGYSMIWIFRALFSNRSNKFKYLG